MATEKWIAGSGVGLTWTSVFTSAGKFDSLASGNALLSDKDITNGTALDVFADASFKAGGAVTTVAPAFLGLYLYPLNQDGSTYGDGRFSSSAAGPPPSCYLIRNIQFAAAASTTINGTWLGFTIPPGTFRFLLYNQAGVQLSTSNVFAYRTYNLAVN